MAGDEKRAKKSFGQRLRDVASWCANNPGKATGLAIAAVGLGVMTGGISFWGGFVAVISGVGLRNVYSAYDEGIKEGIKEASFAAEAKEKSAAYTKHKNQLMQLLKGENPNREEIAEAFKNTFQNCPELELWREERKKIQVAMKGYLDREGLRSIEIQGDKVLFVQETDPKVAQTAQEKAQTIKKAVSTVQENSKSSTSLKNSTRVPSGEKIVKTQNSTRSIGV